MLLSLSQSQRTAVETANIIWQKQNNKIQLHLANHKGSLGVMISLEVTRNSLCMSIHVSVRQSTYYQKLSASYLSVPS